MNYRHYIMATFSGDIIRRNSGDSVEKVAVKEGPRHGVAADESRVQDRTGTVQVAVRAELLRVTQVCSSLVVQSSHWIIY